MSVVKLHEFLRAREAKGIKTLRIVPFWGDEAHKATEDERAAIILDAMKQLEDGRATVLSEYEDDVNPIDVREMLEKL